MGFNSAFKVLNVIYLRNFIYKRFSVQEDSHSNCAYKPIYVFIQLPAHQMCNKQTNFSLALW